MKPITHCKITTGTNLPQGLAAPLFKGPQTPEILINQRDLAISVYRDRHGSTRNDSETSPLDTGKIRGIGSRFTPADCPHCEYDRRFPDFESGGWIRQENNGPIVSCPMCNDDGSHPFGSRRVLP